MPTLTSSAARVLPLGDDGRPVMLQDLAAHVATHGPMAAGPHGAGALIDEIERAGLRGRGGGWFPTDRKMRAVLASVASRAGRRGRWAPVLIANGMEGEPASGKDAVLLAHAPHLVLDGIQAAAAAIGASSAYLAVHRGSPVIDVLDAALAERRGHDGLLVELVTPPARYVASEETALSHWIGEGVATPVHGSRPFQRGVAGRPTLVQNVETLAHVALIARHGGAWFASIGDPDAPGTALVTVGGAVGRAGVVEVATGTPVPAVMDACGGMRPGVTGLLTGGYGGAWAPADAVMAVDWSPAPLREAGAVIGAGVLWALDPNCCPLVEMSRVADFMAGESAGQCGPCRFGLPAVADDLILLCNRTTDEAAMALLRDRLALVANRGGCRHPDGVARFIESGLRTFQAEVDRHLAGSCSATAAGPCLPVPAPRSTPVPSSRRDFR